jgi:hypothetical protein
MPTFFNISNRKGVFMIPSGGTVSPSGNGFQNTKSLSFDGVDEYVSLGTPSFLNATSEFTSSLWFNTNDVGTQTTLWAIGSSASQLWVISKIQDDLIIYGGTSTKYYRKNNLFSINTWYNLIVVYDGSQANADRFKAYLNGVLLTGATINGTIETITPTFTTDFNIGRIGYAAASYFNGNIDEVALWNTTLSPTDISTIATAPSDLSTYNPLAWYRMGDNSTYQTPQILMPENTNKDKVSNWSLEFDGVGDYIDLGTSIDLGINSTISFWFKSSTGNTNHTLIGEDTYSFDYLLQLASGTNTSFVRIGSVVKSFTTTELNDGNWNHWCIVRSGDSVELFINNVSKGTQTGYGTGTNTLFNVIGAEGDFQFPINGSLDEFAVWDSVQDVSSIYNSGTPTTITGATAYWKLGELSKFTDNWLVPNSALSNYSNYSFNFDGIDDYISANKLNLTTAISVSCWVKTTSTATQWLVNEDRTSGTDRNWALLIAGNQINFIVWHTDGTNTQLIRSIALEVQDGNWHHILVTWDGTTNANQFKSFVDGGNEESKTATSTGIRNLSPYGLAIASVQQNAGFRYSGNIDEVAIWDNDQSANVSAIYNSGEPTTIPSGALAHWRMGEDATYNASTSEWTIPDQVGSNDGTSSNTMALDTLVGEAPNYFGGGLSDAMTIEDRVGDAPNSENNAVSFNMEAEDIDNNTP